MLKLLIQNKEALKGAVYSLLLAITSILSFIGCCMTKKTFFILTAVVLLYIVGCQTVVIYKQVRNTLKK